MREKLISRSSILRGVIHFNWQWDVSEARLCSHAASETRRRIEAKSRTGIASFTRVNIAQTGLRTAY
jgi:hypothetical protein